MGPLKRLIGSLFFLYIEGRKRRREEKKGSERLPKLPQSLPKTPQRLPQRLPKLPKASQSLPKGSPRVSQSLPKPPKINFDTPKASQASQSLPETQKREKAHIVPPCIPNNYAQRRIDSALQN